MKSFNIVIIGVGQRGLSILERFSAVVAHDPVPASLTVHLVDPAVPGQGIHESLQPDHLLINTIAGQCTLYTDKSVVGAGPIVEGRTFLDWARDKGYKKVKGKIVRADFGEQIDEHTYLSRAHLGEYLTWVYDKIVANLPSNVTILNHRRQATDIVRRHDQRLQVHLEGGFKIEADFVYLTTGHAGCGADATDLQYESWVEKGRSRNSHLAYFRIPYPISRMNSISSQAKVAICGAGLTTADVVSALTTGLGGVFESVSHDRYKYIPCGREPKITLFSRQGLPASGRAINQKGNAQYKAKFFLTKLTDTLRQRRGSRQLDWDRDLLPTLKREMAHVYDSVQKGEEIDPNGYQPTPEVVAAIEDLCAPLRRRSFVDHESFTRFIRAHLIQDIADCFEGNAQNPRKAASDMLRDIRDNIRYAVDYAGLTPESHAKFLSAWCSISNRISSGPPKERNMELLALMDAGIVSLFGPKPNVSYDEEQARFTLTSTQFFVPKIEHFDVLVRARVELFVPETSTSKLIQNLLASGLVTPFKNGDFKPGGLAIEGLNIVNREGKVVPNMWAVGYVVEGAHFYTYVLPRPGFASRALTDAGKAVLAMYGQIKSKFDQALIYRIAEEDDALAQEVGVSRARQSADAREAQRA